VARPHRFAAARAALVYDDGAKALLLPFKFADRTELAGPLAGHMARAGAGLLARTDILVPVPLHWRRLLGRRYNQAALLARLLAGRAGKPWAADALRRGRRTVPLGELGAEARRAAVAGAFAVAPRRTGLLAGRRVLLIDDVLTSGATADACAEALLAAGVASVEVLVAARVAAPGRGRA
jgi:ComF family protein